MPTTCQGLRPLPVFSISDLSVRTAGGFLGRSRSIVTGVSIALDKQGALAILGRSGAGKTVLWRAMFGLSSPGLSVDYDKRVPALSEAAFERWRRSSVGFLHQGAQRSLVPHHSPQDYLRRLFPKPDDCSGASARFRDAAATLGLPLADRDLNRPIATFSGGEAQRIALALRLAGRPSILVLDEPSAALDFEAAQWMKALVATAIDAFDVAVICVTHDYHFISGLAAHALYLESGRAVEFDLKTGAGGSAQALEWLAMSRQEANEYHRFFGTGDQRTASPVATVPVEMRRREAVDAR